MAKLLRESAHDTQIGSYKKGQSLAPSFHELAQHDMRAERIAAIGVSHRLSSFTLRSQYDHAVEDPCSCAEGNRPFNVQDVTVYVYY